MENVYDTKPDKFDEFLIAKTCHIGNLIPHLFIYLRVMQICVGKLSSIGSIMACRLVGAKPSSEPMLDYSQFDHWEQTLVKF